jgi:hypothetical protein
MNSRTATAGVILALVLGTPPASAKTLQLHIFAYCKPGTNCGFADKPALRNHLLDTVQEMNLQWEFLGISFRPQVTIIEENYYSEVNACNKEELSDARRVEWQNQVAVADTSEIRAMITQGGSWCCANIPESSDTFSQMFGWYCFAGKDRGPRAMGGLWAHELGHYWCMAHTMTFLDSADTAPDPPDWDLDDCCGVLDTPEDPGRAEGYQEDEDGVPVPGKDTDIDGNFLDGHEWCTWNELTPEQAAVVLSDDSPHDTKCTWDCWRQQGGQTNPIYGLLTWERATMSYFGLRCYGPYVLTGGLRREGFSADQKTRVGWCQSTFSGVRSFPDVCQGLGGDTDADGICDLEDNCPLDKNTSQVDTDADGDPDGCDLCPDIPGPHGDIDGDGAGDQCDDDMDGDGCDNDADQHPGQYEFTVGTKFTGCGFGTEAIVGYEWDDVEPDGVVNCLDLDDDDDGYCDEGGPHGSGEPGVPPGGCVDSGFGQDPCPHDPGLFQCHFQGTPVNCPPPWLTCIGTTCVEMFLKFVSVINPAEQVIVPDFQIHGRTIYASALKGFTISELGQAAQGNFSAVGIGDQAGGPLEGASSGAAGLPETGIGDPIQLEIWSKRTGQRVAVVGQYDASRIVLGDVDRGRFLALTPVMGAAGGLAEMRIASTYGRGEPDDESALPDADADGRPDPADRCLLAPDFGQRDTDGDGFGNACDPDVDQDLLVTPADVAAIQACEGADLTVEGLLIEPEDLGYGLGGDENQPADPALVQRAFACRAMDLDGNLLVDAADAAIATAFLGLPPGPSALADGGSPCVGPCDDGVGCTHDYCDAGAGLCRSVPAPGACDDGDVCTVEACDPALGCVTSSRSCDDGNPCTADRCEPEGCVHDPLPDGASCDDGSPCTAGERCDGGACVGGTPTLCDDGDPCTADACDPATGQCVVAGSACDDGDECTQDLCGAAGCQHVLLTGAPCDDADACTSGEACRAGRCEGGTAVTCDDGDACTADACDPAAGCENAPRSCDDGIDCTVDACDLATGGCLNPPVTVGEPGPIAFVDPATLRWPSTAGPKHWNVYRGTIPSSGLASRRGIYDHVCFESADFLLDGPTATHDYSVPLAPGGAWYYLVTEEVDCLEGDGGPASSGAVRPIPMPCITPP